MARNICKNVIHEQYTSGPVLDWGHQDIRRIFLTFGLMT